jgi:hypothetical protein
VQSECSSTVVAAVSLYGSHLARGLEGDLGAGPLKSWRGLRILGLDVGPCIVVLVIVIASAMFS